MSLYAGDLKKDVEQFVHDHIRSSAIERKADTVLPIDAETGSLLEMVIQREMPTVVVDSNVMRNEFSYLASHPEARTTLVSAADARSIRLFAHEHVVEEVHEHIENWAGQLGMDSSVLRNWWITSYLPLLRVIPWSVALEPLLTPEEAARIAILKVRDPDDVPSAMLSIVLGAFYLSEDEAPVEAVYGEPYDRDEVAQWVAVLMAGSSSSEVLKLQAGATIVPTAVAYSLGEALQDLLRWQPALAIGLGVLGIGGAIALARKTTPEVRRILGEGIAWSAGVVNEFGEFERRQYEKFRGACPVTPKLGELHQHLGGEAVLHRAILQTASRMRRVDMSAKELRDQLPVLGAAQREQVVRSALRSSGAFRSVGRGRWSVGFRFAYRKAC
jgi:predicted nucleic acid-binding protein